jgi:hypothetical protein
MKSITIAATIFALASFAYSSPAPIAPNESSPAAAPTTAPNGGPAFDPAGAPHVDNQNGTQFIGGQCINNADCASKCCAFPSGICSGPGASFLNGKKGCGFGGGSSSPAPTAPSSSPAPAAPSSAAAPTASNGGPAFDPAGAPHVDNQNGTQFIGGQCINNADCASKCCAFPSGICSGPGASFLNGKKGCGFGGGSSSPAPAAPSSSPAPAAPSSSAAAASTASNGGPAFDPAGAKNVGNQEFLQFIGGQCINNADCASKCCAFPSGICSGPGAATQNGKKGCGFGGGSSAKRFISARNPLEYL